MHLAFLSRNPSGADQPGPRGSLPRHHAKEFFSILLEGSVINHRGMYDASVLVARGTSCGRNAESH